jgi:heme exporter protein A
MHSAHTLPDRHLNVTGLAIERGGRTVVAGVAFAIAPGEAVLLRGPNGAGKSSLLLALAGILPPAAGAIAWTGGDDERRPVEDMVYCGHQPAVKVNLTVAENLRFWADMLGGERGRAEPAAEAAGLGALLDIAAANLSAGQTRRLALARLLVTDRTVWLLDEPTSALDAAGGRWICGLIDAHLAAGGLVIAATHDDLALSRPVRTLALGPA